MAKLTLKTAKLMETFTKKCKEELNVLTKEMFENLTMVASEVLLTNNKYEKVKLFGSENYNDEGGSDVSIYLEAFEAEEEEDENNEFDKTIIQFEMMKNFFIDKEGENISTHLGSISHELRKLNKIAVKFLK